MSFSRDELEVLRLRASVAARSGSTYGWAYEALARAVDTLHALHVREFGADPVTEIPEEVPDEVPPEIEPRSEEPSLLEKPRFTVLPKNRTNSRQT